MKAGRGFEAYRECHLVNRQVGLTEQPRGFLQTDVPEILAKGFIVSLFEFLGESSTVRAHSTAYIIAREFFVTEEIITAHHLFELKTKITERILSRRRLQRGLRRTWDLLDSIAKKHPSDRRGDQIEGISPVGKPEDRTEDINKNNRNKGSGTD